MKIRSLMLLHNFIEDIDKLNTSLPHVESIVWRGCHQSLPKELVDAVLRVCPNVVHLEQEKCVGFSPDIAAHVPKLRRFHLTGHSISTDDKMIESVLMVFGPQLRVLRLPHFEIPYYLIRVLCEKCPLLETMESGDMRTNLQRYLVILQTCKHLSDFALLTLSSFAGELDLRMIADMVTAAPQLKRLTVQFNCTESVSYGGFVTVRELRPDLEHLEIGGWRYTAAEGILHMRLSTGMEASIIARVLKQCPGVKELLVSALYENSALLVDSITQHLHGTLHSLNVVANGSHSVEILLRGYGATLKHLELKGDGVTDDLLHVAGALCPRLEIFALNNTFMFDDNGVGWLRSFDAGVTSLLSACPLLKTVKFDQLLVSVAILHAIIKSRLRLTTLRWTLDNSRKEWFYLQIKEHQLLPMPVISIIE